MSVKFRDGIGLAWLGLNIFIFIFIFSFVGYNFLLSVLLYTVGSDTCVILGEARGWDGVSGTRGREGKT